MHNMCGVVLSLGHVWVSLLYVSVMIASVVAIAVSGHGNCHRGVVVCAVYVG